MHIHTFSKAVPLAGYFFVNSFNSSNTGSLKCSASVYQEALLQ